MLEELHLIPAVQGIENTSEPPEPFCLLAGPYYLSVLLALSGEASGLSLIRDASHLSPIRSCRLLLEGKVVDEHALLLQKGGQILTESPQWPSARPVKTGAQTSLILTGPYEDTVLSSVMMPGVHAATIGRRLGRDFPGIDERRSSMKNEYVRALLDQLHRHRQGRSYLQMYQELKQHAVAQQQSGVP